MTSRCSSARSHSATVLFVDGPPQFGAIFDTSAVVALLVAIVLVLTTTLPQPATSLPAVSATAASVARSSNSTARIIFRNSSSGAMATTKNVRHKMQTSSTSSSASRHHVRHGHHGRSALGHRDSGAAHASHHHYAIARPGMCAAVESVYDDCFLCGKVANEIRIYRGCCNGDIEIVRFCNRLLS